MCEFCIKHGEGKKWYLRAENYSAELREKMNSVDMAVSLGKNFDTIITKGEKLANLIKRFPPTLKKFAVAVQGMLLKKAHFGQVVPIEDLEKIFDMMTSVIRIPCICRRYNRKDEGRYCLGVTVDPMPEDTVHKLVIEGPNLSGFEYMTREEVKNLVRQFDKKGLIHTVWTVQTPYIAAICNCDSATCTGLKFHHEGLKTLFRAEYVAVVDINKCVGCRACIKKCQFNALHYNEDAKKVFIDPQKCYGCGLCRVPCEKDAISLMERKEHAIAANIW